MKTKAGKKVVRDITKDKKEIMQELKQIALELKKFNAKGTAGDQYLYGTLLARAKSYKQQLEKAQEHVNIAVFLESFLD